MTPLPGEIPHLPFDTLGPTAEVAHPYLPAEHIALNALHDYYTRSRGEQTDDPREVGWLQLERAVHTGEATDFDQAEASLAAAARIEDLAATPSAINTHLALACIDAFRDRTAFGAVRPKTADTTYKKIVRLLNNVPVGGYSAEVTMLALGARMARERPADFIYPSTPREGENELHNKGKTYNHDGYTLNPYKTPIESKLHIRVHTPMSDYDDRTFRSFFLSLFSLTPDGPRIAATVNEGQHAAAARWLLDRVKMRMTEELNGADNSDYFSAVQDYLRANLREHRRINPMALEFDIPPKATVTSSGPDTAEHTPRSVGEVMAIINAALQSLSEDDIHFAMDKLALAQEQLLAGGQGSEQLNEIAIALQGVPSERLQAALDALTAAREKLTAYLDGISSAHLNQ